MTGPRSPEERISLWLEEEAEGQLPDRVLAATFQETRAIRARPGPTTWRPFPMSRSIVSLLAVGATAIIVVLGFNALRPATAIVGATPSPSSIARPSASASPAATAASPLPRSRPYGLAIVGLDGSIRQELGLPPDSWTAALSPDGKRIAFTTSSISVGTCGGCGSPRRLAVVDVGSTTGAFVFPQSDAIDLGSISQPAWSPDGSALAFMAADRSGNVDIYVTALAPNGPTFAGVTHRLTTDPAIDEFPAWSPDGKTIIYDNLGSDGPDESGFSATQELWSVPAGGGTPRRLTQNTGSDAQPDVSGNGTVVFWRDGDLWTMHLDGKGQQRLTSVAAGLGFSPRWSPDGRTIALLQYDPTERAHLEASYFLPADLPLLKVLVVDARTGAATTLGPRTVSDVNPPSWSPDGSGLLVYEYDDPSRP